jgi:hypothetical protein
LSDLAVTVSAHSSFGWRLPMPVPPIRRPRILIAALIVILIALVSIVAWRLTDTGPTEAPPPQMSEELTSTPSDPTLANPLEMVESLRVAGRAPMTDYDRDQFGPAWEDVDGNGCDTRNDILRRDLVDIQPVDQALGCEVQLGILHDPYSGQEVNFVRGELTSTDVQIDHVVALGDAWQKGAQSWTYGRRLQFANDPLNLLAVDGTLNQQKGAGDTATWLPPDRSYWCTYVTRQVAVKVKYGVWVTAAERAAMIRVIEDCP